MKWKVEKEAGLTTHTRGSQTSLTKVPLLCPVPGLSETAEVLKGETGLGDSVLPGGGWALREPAGVGSPLGRDQGRGGGCHSELSPGR